MRYRVIYATDPSGAYSEFTAGSDQEAIAEAMFRARYHGEIISLTQGGEREVVRTVLP
jgi:hypothetical protein